MAESCDGKALLVGEVKLSATTVEIERIHKQLNEKAAQLPFTERYQRVETVVFSAAECRTKKASAVVMIPDLLRVLI